MAADGALSLTVTSTGTPFRILSPKHGIFVNADACAFQRLLLRAILSGKREKFQDNLDLPEKQAVLGRDPGAEHGSAFETSSVVFCGSSETACSGPEDAPVSEDEERKGWRVCRVGKKLAAWRIGDAAD